MQYYEYLNQYLISRNESGSIVSPSVMGVVDPVLIRLVGELAGLQLQQKQVGLCSARRSACGESYCQ